MITCEGWWGDYGPADKDKSGPAPKGQSQVKKPATPPSAAPASAASTAGTRVVAPVIRWARKP